MTPAARPLVLFPLAFAALALAAGCHGPVGEAAAALAEAAAAGDGADHDCRVVLRRADHLVDARGVGVLATIDVAASVGATPSVLFAADGAGWQEAVAVPDPDGSPPGWTRWQARFAVAQSADFIAFVHTSDGGRLFDHNRLPGALDSFHVDASNGFAVAEAPLVCPTEVPVAELDFLVGWRQQQHGALVAGAQFTVAYDAARLQTCRGSGWTLDAFAQFAPSGAVVSGNVASGPLTVDIPAGTTAVALWFHNAASGCDAWDSNLGANYQFAVTDAITPPIGWLSAVGGSTNRDCLHRDTLADPIVIDEFAREQSCLFADGDVWIGGVTDGNPAHPEYVMAEVEWHKDAQPPVDSWLDDVGRVGNNERFRWQLPYELRSMADWTTATYQLRFSVDGHSWTYAEGGRQRTIQRAFILPQ